MSQGQIEDLRAAGNDFSLPQCSLAKTPYLAEKAEVVNAPPLVDGTEVASSKLAVRALRIIRELRGGRVMDVSGAVSSSST